MRKYILTILLICVMNIGAYAANTRDILTSVENGVFGYDYHGDSDIKRVERLEEYFYGAKKTGAIQARVESLQNDSGIIVEAKKPKKVNNKQEQTGDIASNQQNPKRKDVNLKEDATVEYAIVDKMEKDLFKQTYKNENIYERLNRLEMTVFQHTNNEDLSSRVDKLASIIRPSGRRVPSNETIAQEELQRLYSNNELHQIDDQTMPFQLATLESDILKHEYIGDSNASRLSRLEQKLFNRTFPNDADVPRLQRVCAAYEAKKNSYKYENNKKMQNMATVSQIGGILLMILAILL